MSARKDKGLAVVTGASQGIGAVYARKLAERGHDVVLVARNRDRLRANAAEIRAATSREAEVVVADLSTAADTSALAERLRSDPAISVLINNAGATLDGGLLANDADAVARQIALNVTAPTLLAQAAAKAFIARGGGAIVNISSVAAFVPEMFDGAYSGSKMYLLNLTLGLASKAKDSGVRFQAVLPGPTNTDMWARRGRARERRSAREDHGAGRSRRSRPHGPRPWRSRHCADDRRRSRLAGLRSRSPRPRTPPCGREASGALPRIGSRALSAPPLRPKREAANSKSEGPAMNSTLARTTPALASAPDGRSRLMSHAS